MDERQLDDTILINRITQGHESALSELYDRYGRLLFSIAVRVVGNQESSEEITLDIFNNVWQKAHTYDANKSKVVTWLTRMTRNRAIDKLRYEGVRLDNESIHWHDLAVEPVTDSHNPEFEAALNQQRASVRHAIATLPEAQQEALALAYFKGMSHQEIANYINQPLGTVKGRIRAGMKALRLLLVDT